MILCDFSLTFSCSILCHISRSILLRPPEGDRREVVPEREREKKSEREKDGFGHPTYGWFVSSIFFAFSSVSRLRWFRVGLKN